MSGDGSETPTPPTTSSDGVQEAQADAPKAEEIPVEVEAPAAPDWEAKIATLEKEKKDNWDRYLRAAADLENLRKRTKREIEDAKYEAKIKTLKEMLPVIDNLERAIEHAGGASGTNPPNPIVEGVQLVLRQFTTAFERLEVVPVEAQDKPFDPNLHEAISQQESDAPPGTIVQVLQRGYKIGERLLRPSLVVVAKPQAPKPAE